MNDLPSPHSGAPDYPVVLLLFAIIPVILILTGMVLGFTALRDIRLADGALGGALMATFAAGLLPAAIIINVFGIAMTVLAEAALAHPGRHSGLWTLAGVALGLWVSFLMMRRMYREARGYAPRALASLVVSRSALSTAAIVLTIVGAAMSLLILVESPDWLVKFNSRKDALLLDLAVLLAGFICGMLSLREASGKTCAWISGSLFAVLLLLFAA